MVVRAEAMGPDHSVQDSIVGEGNRALAHQHPRCRKTVAIQNQAMVGGVATIWYLCGRSCDDQPFRFGVYTIKLLVDDEIKYKV